MKSSSARDLGRGERPPSIEIDRNVTKQSAQYRSFEIVRNLSFCGADVTPTGSDDSWVGDFHEILSNTKF